MRVYYPLAKGSGSFLRHHSVPNNFFPGPLASRSLYTARLLLLLLLGYPGGLGGSARWGIANFVIDSNYKWLLLAFAVLWGLTLRLFWFERRNIDDQTILTYSDREGGDAALSQPLCPQADSC